MSDKQEMDIITVAKTANLQRPKTGTETSFEKHQGSFHAVWGILFQNAGPAPESPFCEDFKSGEPGMLSDSIFSSWSDRAFKRGEISDPADFQASRKDFNEMAQELLATFRDHRPNFVGSSQPLPSDSMTSNQRFGSSGAAAETPERKFLQSPGLTPNWSPFGDEHPRRVSFDSPVLVSDDPVVQPGSAAADMIRWRTTVSQELRQYPEFPVRLPITEASTPMAPVPSVRDPAEAFAEFDDFLRAGNFYTSGETQSSQTLDAPLDQVPLVSTMDPMIASDGTPGVGVDDPLNYLQWDDGGISASTSATLHPMHFSPQYQDIEESW
ncbi:hypothetical protein BDP81DRAFT_420058 [Colletotrichum phormii]|uniref:Uncharacterized protein n=1 Tax=Colletotrichum phormii TaxID=359342 RepID=A0AAI9ZYZ8_9PEZI|nr:uncharacterized protein BDP81DRAFT_420058 [Colletotrichum phormii]KAK1640446.1 hypothetical protein BDP81DRAFT_420058 [Colletotrichum phormii]